jgi:pimeloyl-ACP methyl ester carboxylesterase
MGWSGNFDDDLEPFRLLNIAKDALGLVFALGRRTVDGLVGHDFGSLIAATCALVRPDVFRSVVLMSAPFAGAPAIGDSLGNGSAIDDALAALNPPRKHYRWHHATRSAEADILDCKQGLHDFLRAYYHVKSADWSGNRPFPLNSWTAGELSKLPTYYIMDREADMASTVAPYMPSTEEISRCEWLPDNVLRVSTAEFSKTGFQGALNCYRVITEPRHASSLEIFDGRTIDVPSLFISGASDWGVYQIPHGFAKMRSGACTRLHGCHLIEGAGHWVQQEQPERVVELLRKFFARYASSLAA